MTLPPRLHRPPLTVRVRPGPPLAAVLENPALRSAAARMGEALIQRWPRAGGCTVVVAHSRQTIYSLRARGDGLIFNVHWAILEHEADLMATVLFRDKVAWRRLQAAFGAWQSAVEKSGGLPPPRQHRLDPRGQVYNLADLFAEQNETHFKGELAAPIGWGRWSPRESRARIRLGSCGGQPPRIRVHPVLDHGEVPLPFVRFIVFHEMLHLAMPPRPGSGSRRLIHPKAFRAVERAHPDYEFASAWERENVTRLLQRARRPRS